MRGLFRSRLAILPLRGGGKMAFDTTNKLEVSMYLDLFSPETLDTLRLALRPGDTFLDCGANVGYFSFVGARMVGSSGRVIAVDADPHCVARLNQSVAATNCGNVRVLPVAIGEHAGSIELNVAKDHMFSSVCDIDQLGWTSRVSSVSVRVRTVDEILRAELPDPGSRVRLWKIDVEGSEVAALRGAFESLSIGRFDFIYVEVHPLQLKILDLKPAEIHEILISKGYRLLREGADTGSCFFGCPAAEDIGGRLPRT
jgi:FkbM family methyltransferase